MYSESTALQVVRVANLFKLRSVVVLCMDCTGRLQSKQCPLCRAKIEKVVKAKNNDERIQHAAHEEAAAESPGIVAEKLDHR